ncbi:MAG: helicase-related protein, partial [Gammaproteobacteria bacterium]|nr:helicase-related protein [Gammaproteobacteria bacterium]
IAHGVGVHHAGLSDEVRVLMERLFEEDELRFLVATTTIAQGVNFPISGVVMASHQYPYGEGMPPEDFWNIAGRTGRIGQGSIGVVAFVANNQEKANILREFINEQSGELNSALITLAQKAGDLLNDLGEIVKNQPEWSAFVQYLAHTYRQMGQPEGFANDIEQVLRNTFGFEKLRAEDSTLANRLLNGVRSYTDYLQEPDQPIKLVDSTGFSLESIKTVMNKVEQAGIGRDTWNADSLFSQEDQNLQAMMGVLRQVPELRKNLNVVTGEELLNEDKLALIIKDWVNGASVKDISERYFMAKNDDVTQAMTKCGQNLFGKLTQTTAWGLGALLSITESDMPEDQMHTLNNLPSRVYYGVNDDAAIALRLLGIPRSAATRLADSMGDVLDEPLSNVRSRLRDMDEANWWQALGEREGEIYRKVWRMLEGLD